MLPAASGHGFTGVGLETEISVAPLACPPGQRAVFLIYDAKVRPRSAHPRNFALLIYIRWIPLVGENFRSRRIQTLILMRGALT
jgi:hypothetical protein